MDNKIGKYLLGTLMLWCRSWCGFWSTHFSPFLVLQQYFFDMHNNCTCSSLFLISVPCVHLCFMLYCLYLYTSASNWWMQLQCCPNMMTWLVFLKRAESLCVSYAMHMCASSWVLHPGCFILGAPSWVLDPGCLILGAWSWVLHPGCSILGASSWVLPPGCSWMECQCLLCIHLYSRVHARTYIEEHIYTCSVYYIQYYIPYTHYCILHKSPFWIPAIQTHSSKSHISLWLESVIQQWNTKVTVKVVIT